MKLDPYKFVEKKKDKLKLRPHFGGVYHKNGYIYATDALVLIKKKADYPRSMEGKVIGKKGDVIGTNYPNADALIHDRSEYEAFSLDVEELDRFVKKLKDDDYESPVYLYDRNMSLKSVSFYDPTNPFQRKYHTAAEIGTTGIVLLAIPILKQMVYFMKAEKTNLIWMNKTVSYTRPVMVYGNDSTLLAMPVTGGGDTDWYRKFPVAPVKVSAAVPVSDKKESKKIKMEKPTKQKSKSTAIDPFNYVSRDPRVTDRIRSYGGVYHSKGYQYASDGYTNIKIRASYNPSLEGKTVERYGYELKGNYPHGDWTAPAKSTLKAFKVNTDNLLKEIGNTNKKGYTNAIVIHDRNTKMVTRKSTVTEYQFPEKDNWLVDMKLQQLMKMITFMKNQNTDVMWMSRKNTTNSQVYIFGKTATLEMNPIGLKSTMWKDGYNKDWFYAQFPVDPVSAEGQKTATKTKTDTTMRKTTTRRKTAARKSTGGNTIARAASILRGQKKEYQRIFTTEVKKKGVDSKKAAVKAGSIYRKKYGSTAQARWKNAISTAKRFERS